MAGSQQRRDTRRQSERVVPSIDKGSSRVSRAAGELGSSRMQGTQVEQRSSAPRARQAPSRQATRGQTSPRTPAASRSGARPDATSTRRKNSGSNRPTAEVADPRDIKFIKWANDKWNSMEPHQQQRVFGGLLLVLSLLLFGSLTVFSSTPVFSAIAKFFVTIFGWSAYLLSIGLIAFSVAHLIEGIRNERFIRWSMVLGLLAILLLLLIESRLIMGRLSVGVLAELFVTPLLGWPGAVQHVLIIGLLLIAIIIAFRITFGHVLLALHFIQRLIGDPGTIEEEEDEDEEAPSPFTGQRPQYSRYASSLASADPEATILEPAAARPVVSRAGATAARQRNAAPLVADDVIEVDDGTITFEADFDDEEDDPLNDINLHKQHVGAVKRGPRAPEPIDLDQAVTIRDASQFALPFDQQEEEEPPRLIVRRPSEAQPLEPLAPNPVRATASASRAGRTRGAQQQQPPPQPPVTITSTWKVPDISILNSTDTVKMQMYGDDTQSLARTIQETLRSFRVDAEVRPEDISIGPTVIRFGIRPTGKPEMMLDEKTGKMVPVRDAAGNIIYETRTRVSRIMALQNDLALVLEAKTIRMEAPVPGRPYVGVEIPNKNSRLVTLREVLESKEYSAAKAKSNLAIGLGKDVAGLVRVGDLARMPHMLIAGATGAGKSVCINAIIASFLTQATPDDVRMLMVDPKMVELSMYNGIPHLLAPVVTEVDKVVPLLKNAINEMERRYRLFSQLGVRNLDSYRKMRLEKMAKGDNSLNNLPAIVIIIDELADLMMAAPEEVEGMICRLAQLARATGIHLVVATQRPSVDVITGLIKANIPTRISFMVSSAVDSRTIIDMGGAERLLGRGDMLYLPADAGRPERIQCSFLADEEAERLVQYWKEQVIEHLKVVEGVQEESINSEQTLAIEPGWELRPEDSSDDFDLDDELLDKAEEIVREYGRASISLLQRRLRIGYSRAARLIDLLEEHGIIGQYEASGRAREVLNSQNDYSRADDDSTGHTVADAVDDIVEEERARNEFLRKQATNRNYQPHRNGYGNQSAYDDQDEEE